MTLGRLIAGGIVAAVPVSMMTAILVYGYRNESRRVFWIGIAFLIALAIGSLILIELATYATYGRWLRWSG